MGNTSDSIKKDRKEDIEAFESISSQPNQNQYRLEDFSTPFSHHQRIHTIIYDPIRKCVWTGGLDRAICRWNVKNGRCTQVLSSHTSTVSSLDLDLDEDNGLLFSGGYDGACYGWDVKTGHVKHVYPPTKSHITTLATYRGTFLFVGGYDCVIFVIHQQNAKVMTTLKGHSMRVEDLQVSPDEGILFSSSIDGTIRQWDIDLGKCTKIYSHQRENLASIFQLRKRKCFDLGLYKDRLFCKSGEEEVSGWNRDKNKAITQLSGQDSSDGKKKVAKTGKPPFTLSFSAFCVYENWLIGWNVPSISIEIWDLRKNEVVRRIKPTGNVIRASMIVCNGEYIFYTAGSTVIKVDFPKIRKRRHSEVSVRMMYSDLFHYFVKVCKYPEKELTELIMSLHKEKSLPKCQSLDEQVKLLERRIEMEQSETPSIQSEKKVKPVDKSKEEVEGENDDDEKTPSTEEIKKKEEEEEEKKRKSEEEEEVEGENEDDESAGGSPKRKVVSEDPELVTSTKTWDISEMEISVGDKIESIFTEEQLQQDLETRTELFYRQIYQNYRDLQPTVMVVRRENLVFDACKHFSLLHNSDFRKPMYVFFANEEGLDTGGVTREFYHLLAQQILNPNHALFLITSSGSYHPNPASAVNQAHLQYFEFIGKLVGKAFYDMQMLDLHFTPVLFKLVCGRSVGFEDLALVEPITYTSLKRLLDMENVESLDLTFTVDMNDFGLNQTFPLVEDGEKIKVTDENKMEFVSRYTQWLMVDSVRPQLEKLLKGVYDVIPRSNFEIFGEKELELILCGSKKIDLDDWRENTTYEGFDEFSVAVEMFWSTMNDLMSQVEHSKMLQFVTGTACVPIEGFKALSPKFSICKMLGGSSGHLPIAHTCLNRLEIPLYDSKKQCYEKLVKAMDLGKTFGKT